MTKSIALIEFSTGHVECLYAQAEILRSSGYRVLLVCNEESRERIGRWPGVDELVDEILTVRTRSGIFPTLNEIRDLIRRLQQRGISLVVLNTFVGKMVQSFVLFSKGFEVFGIVHHVDVLRRYWVRRAGQRMGGFFVLNDYLLPHCPLGVRVQSFYPIRFPAFDLEAPTPTKAPDEFWVCVPGNLEYKRRDYLGLLEELDDKLDPRVRFVLLGSANHPHGDGADFAERTASSDRFVTFADFVDDVLFHHYLGSSDLVLPLNGADKRYNSISISGTFNLSFAYRIPMLVEPHWLQVDDFQVSAFGYRPGALVERLNELAADPALLANKSAEMERYSKFTFEAQRDAYLGLIENGSPDRNLDTSREG